MILIYEKKRKKKPHAAGRNAVVGASLLAMVVNDDACLLVTRGVLETIASKLAPTTALRPAG
jgi:hypothetical protein